MEVDKAEKGTYICEQKFNITNLIYWAEGRNGI